MLVVSLRGVRDGKSPYLPIQVSLRALLKDMYKKWQDVCFSMVYFSCQFKQDGLPVLAWATSILVSLRGLILIFRQACPSLWNGSPLEFLRQVTGGFLWGRWRAVKPSFLFPVFSRGFSANEIFFTMRSPRSKKITKYASYSAWSESCVLIGYPSEQDWPVLPALVPWEKSYFYWPSLFCQEGWILSSFFTAFLLTDTWSRSTETQKWTWPIFSNLDLSLDLLLFPFIFYIICCSYENLYVTRPMPPFGE